MEKRKKSSLMSIGKNFTATASVALLLFVLGIVGLLGIMAGSISRSMRSNIGFHIYMTDMAAPTDVDAVTAYLDSAEYVASYVYLSPEQIAADEEKFTGCDVNDLFGVNIYPPEFEVKVKPDYANSADIDAYAAELEALPYVDEVARPSDMADRINRNINYVAYGFLILAAILLIISFVLINNTVRLTIFSRRFLLYTMRLVGATGAFIRRPIIISYVVNGLIAAVIAIALLCGVRAYIPKLLPDFTTAVPWNSLALLFVGIALIGMAVCALASIFATNKYLRQSYNDLF